MSNICDLVTACRNLNIYAVDRLLRSGADVNATDSSGCTPLIWSCSMRNLQLVDKLIKHGADVNAISDSGYTAIMHASMANSIEIVKLLLDNGAKTYYHNRDTNELDSNNPFMCACGACDGEIVDFFLETGADANIVYPDGTTALINYISCREFDTDTAKSVLEKLILRSKFVVQNRCDGITAFDIYNENGYTFLDKTYLDMLEGKTVLSATKSARNNFSVKN